MKRTAYVGIGLVWGCATAPPVVHPGAAGAPLSIAADARMLTIPAGKFVAGSTIEERAAAYDEYQQTSSSDTARERKWFEGEADRHLARLPTFRIDLMPITQAQYAEFVVAGHAPPPALDEAHWKAQGFAQDYATEVARFVWAHGRPPPGKEDHPAVLVTWGEADRYCAWRGDLVGTRRRLPTAMEFEKAARGDSGLAYPWGNVFEPDKLNSAVGGPRDTVPVGAHLAGASPYGALDMAGNVYQWTSTPFPDGEMTVKGSAWDDFAGVGRGASAHGRPRSARHIIVGFRCAADATP